MNIYTNFFRVGSEIDEDQNYWLKGCFFGTSKKIEIPSFFDEKKGGDGNNVCHVKPLNVGMQVTQGSDTQPLRTGRLWINYHTRLPTASYREEYVIHGRDMYIYKVGYQGYGYYQWNFCITKVKYSHSGSTEYCGLPNYNVFDIWYWSRSVDAGRQWIYRRDNSLGVYGNMKEYCLNAIAGLVLTSKMPSPNDIPYYSSGYSEQVYNNVLDELIAEIPPGFFDTSGRTAPISPGNTWEVTVSTPSKNLADYLLLDEHALLFESGLSMKPYAASRLKALRQDSYLDALDHIPMLNENSISNIMELVGFIKALVIDHRIEIPKSLQSLWLSYRYSYTTTKSDAEEAIAFMHRHVNDDFLNSGFSCYGITHENVSGVNVTVRCRLDVKQKELDTLSKIWTTLYRYGLTPSFYVVWDMVPYSFIVDWFIPVGDILSGYDKTRMYDRTYDITNVWYSIKYSQVDDGCAISSYTRWQEGSPPEFNGYYTLINKGTTSDKTIGFRVLDALSILIR